MFSIASDAVTTKGFMHAFCGVKASFINNRWELEEHLLDLHPLEGDHSGESTARLIFKALRK
jgi:hypothetical protein